MIGIVIRDLAYLKLLHPICTELKNSSASYIIYHMDCNRGEKQYNNASLINIERSSPAALKHANDVIKFKDDKQLLSFMARDKIKKLVSVEIGLWANKYIDKLRNHKIRTYSLLYLTDSLWQNPKLVVDVDKVYYASDYLMKTYLNFANIKHNKSRDKSFGSPLFDPINNKLSDGSDILLLLPNIRKNHVAQSFGNSKNFRQLIEKLSHGGNLIFKTRKKQWLPNEIREYAKDIVYDGNVMYPPVMSDLLKQCYCTVMFFSSGVYECVYGGNKVYNIPLPLKRWNWDKNKLQRYFSLSDPSVYQFPGVVESVSKETLIGPGNFMPLRASEIWRKQWIDKYIGTNIDNCSKRIVSDILED